MGEGNEKFHNWLLKVIEIKRNCVHKIVKVRKSNLLPEQFALVACTGAIQPNERFFANSKIISPRKTNEFVSECTYNTFLRSPETVSKDKSNLSLKR